jgi:Spy/CpxP family protein refolding chaperone
MRPLPRFVCCAVGAALVACDSSNSTTAPNDDLAQQQAAIAATLPGVQSTEIMSFDRAGIGAHAFPESIALTAEQKAAIERLHAGFREAHKDDIDALIKLDADIHAALTSGKSREDVRGKLEQAMAIQRRRAGAHEDLYAAIWQIYTPAQRAWLEHQTERSCRPLNKLDLTREQERKIQALREAFTASVKNDLELIKSVAEEARKAHEAGKPKADVEKILAKAKEAMTRVREAEARLEKAILDVLTPQQRERLCKGSD